MKCCHGYLGHEFLSAFDRPGPYGGDFEGRTRFIREIIAAIRTECPELAIGIRLSLWDTYAYRPDAAQSVPANSVQVFRLCLLFRALTGVRSDRNDPQKINLAEPIQLIEALWREHGVVLWNLTAGSPYYNPHVQRPAIYPPSDGYFSARRSAHRGASGRSRQYARSANIRVSEHRKRTFPPRLCRHGIHLFSGVPAARGPGPRAGGWVGQHRHWAAGSQRLAVPHEVLNGRDYVADKKVCRTFSDCTTAPRNGIISGCYPLDPYYKELPEADELKRAKGKKA